MRPKVGVLLTLADLFLLVLAGYLASRVALSFVVRPVYQAGSSPAPSEAGTDQDRSSRGDDHLRAVLDRNLFGAALTREVPPSPGEEGPGSFLPAEEPPLAIRLLGTVVVEGGRSFAVLEEGGDQKVRFAGDSVGPGAILARVERNRITVLRGDRSEVVDKARPGESGRPSPPGAPPVRPVLPSGPREAAQSPSEGGGTLVRKVGENSFQVDRRELEGAMGNFNQLLSQIRLVPNFSEGKPDGFKLFNIRPNSPFQQMGMVNGDVIKRVNGLEITGPEQALQIFQQLKEQSSITLDLERFRRNLTLRYEIN